MLEWQSSYVLNWQHFKLFKRFKNKQLHSSEPKIVSTQEYTYAASGSEQSPFSLLYTFLLVLLWSFDLLWGHDLPVSRILRQLSMYKVKMWAPRPIPNLRATVSLFVRHLAQNLTGMGGLTSNQAAAGNFIELRLIFGGPQCGTSCVSPSWRLEYWGSSYILWETRAPL